jgi:hypothetical protein
MTTTRRRRRTTTTTALRKRERRKGPRLVLLVMRVFLYHTIDLSLLLETLRYWLVEWSRVRVHLEA